MNMTFEFCLLETENRWNFQQIGKQNNRFIYAIYVDCEENFVDFFNLNLNLLVETLTTIRNWEDVSVLLNEKTHSLSSSVLQMS